MKILQVVTYISPDGAYGGPLRVALNQAKELKKVGHDVLIAAASGGFDAPLPDRFDGVPVKLFRGRRVFPGTGYASMTALSLLKWLIRAVKQADVVHVHMARDLITLPAAGIGILLRKPVVIQTHGMIDPSTKLLAKLLDILLTRTILRRADAVLYLTEEEKQQLHKVAGDTIRVIHLPNGVTVPQSMAVEQSAGPRSEPEIVFLARLHARKRPIFVVYAALALQHKWPNAHFKLFGPDEGEGQKVRRVANDAAAANFVCWYGAIPPQGTIQKLLDASIFVLPSIDEPFGMSVAEAMAVGLPVVITDECGLAPIVRAEEAGIVCNTSQKDFTAAVERLLLDEQLRIQLGKNARRAAQEHFSIDAVIAKLVGIYGNLTYLKG